LSEVDRFAVIEQIINTLRYPGKRMTAKKIAKVIDRIPHDTYVEPMVGMGTVYFATSPVKNEVLNDIDCKVIRTMKREACKNPKSSKCERLKNAKITCGLDYKKVMKKHDSKNTLHYLDPPYEGTRCDYNYCDVPTTEITKTMKQMRGTVLMSNDPKNRKEICGDDVKCRIIPFKFWGQPRKDMLAIKK